MVASITRPAHRRWNNFLGRARRGLSRAAALVARSGALGRPEFEQLEQRQMLFAMTITPEMVNPTTGVGTMFAFFGYAIPYLAPTAEPQDAEPDLVEEDFNTNVPGVPGTPAAVVISPFQWPQSNFRVEHGVTLMQLVQVEQSENHISVLMQGGQSFTLSITQFNLAMTSLAMTIRGNFSSSNMTVELLRDGQVIDSFTGLALEALGVPPGGAERRFTFAATDPAGWFDQIRFRANPGAPNLQFFFDDLAAVTPARPFDPILEGRLWGAMVAFTGPAGATAEFFDLYDRSMRATIAIGAPNNLETFLIDKNGDGIPEFNDGIGRIVLSGVNHRSAITIFGGEIGFATTPPTDADFLENGFFFRIVGDALGLFDDFEDGGFGFAARPNDTTWDVTGLPQGVGSVIIGSPAVRPQGNYNVNGIAPTGQYIINPAGVTTVGNFNRANQGIFVTDGSNMGSVYVHGMLLGSSRFNGFVERIIVGTLIGSIAVNGDLGYLYVMSDAGLWVDDDGTAPNGAAAIRTNSQVVVGRTMVELVVVGRNMVNLQVIGDLNSPGVRPGRDVLRYYEREYATGQLAPQTVRDVLRNIISNNAAIARNNVLGQFGNFFGRVDQKILFTLNDTISTAEWVGSIATAVEIHGQLGVRDILTPTADPADVFAFPVDGTQDIVVELGSSAFVYARIVDINGRTLAAPQLGAGPRNLWTLRYRPNAPGVYYLVVQTEAQSATQAIIQDYIIKVSGIAPTTLGAIRSGASVGNPVNTGLTSTVNVLAGNVGAFIVDSGMQTDLTAILNIGEDVSITGLRGGSYNFPGNLYAILAGDDIEGTLAVPVEISVGGNLGLVRTGLLFPNDPEQGDFRHTRLVVGGAISMLDIQGGIGYNQDVDDRPYPIDQPATVVIRSGVNPSLKGDIGFIRAGSHVGGDTLIVRTSNNSTLGGFAVSQHPSKYYETDEIDFGIHALTGLANGNDFNLGFNSDFRFFDAPRIDLFNILDYTITIPTTGQGYEFTDDAGGRVRIRIVGGGGLSSGTIRYMPVAESLGAALGRIEVNLDGGGVLEITSLGTPGNNQVISIGRISITGSTAASAIRITGPTQVDVWRIVHEDGEGFNEIVNRTPRGDIVAIDMNGLNRVEIGSGNLGRTQVPAWGPKLLGPFLGIAQGTGEIEGPIGIPGAAMTEAWNGAMFRAVNQSNFGRPPSSWLDDVGSPVDPYLNGVIVRTGGLLSVEVGGAIGDVLVPNGVLGNVIANVDMVTPPGEFHGLVGNIHAVRISRVDIGDGLAPREPGPMATTGITATDDINLVIGTRIPGANISSNIIAANINPNNADPATFPVDGIARIELRGGGHIVDAYIGATPLDDFWWSLFAQDSGGYTGRIAAINGFGANFLRSEARAEFIDTILLTNGFYDASVVHVSNDIGRIEARGFRNSTISGGDLEVHENRITAGVDLGILTTTGRLGDINDLRVDVGRRIGEASARNITRSRIEADSEIALLTATQNMRASEIVTGLLTTATFGQSIRSSKISVAGPLVTLTASDSITNTEITVSGPDGRIGTITATNLLSGSITSAGPIGTIRVTQGDMVARIRTVTNARGEAGDIGLLAAGRDLDIRTDVAGTINQLTAGRHLGNRDNPRIIQVHGDIQNVSVPNGQLYSELRVGQRVLNVTIGAVVNRPANSLIGAGSIIAFGRIENVTIEGDFGGDIISYSGGIGVITINNGSFLPGALIAAYDGTLNNIVINSGNLYGNVHADYHILSIRLNGSADGVFGHIGINPAYSAGTFYSANRNQHPPGVIAQAGIQGPRITAGHNVGRVILTNGSIFETFIYAGRAIGTIEARDIRNDDLTHGFGSVIAAGSTINAIVVFGNMSDTMIISGVRDFGANQRPGGVGASADTVESGRILSIRVSGNATNVIVSAGMDPGPDGFYNTADDLVVMGISYVREVFVGGTVSNVSVYADSPTVSASNGIVLAGSNFTQRDPDIHPGGPIGTEIPNNGTPFTFTWNGDTVTATFTTLNNRGRAFWDADTGRLVLVNTGLFSNLTVSSASGRLTDFAIVSNDNASMGTIRVLASLFGDSKIVVDAYVLGIETGNLNDNTTIRIGMNVRSIITGSINGGTIDARYWARDIVVNGNFGTTADFDEAFIRLMAGSTITINGRNAAFINVDRDMGGLTVNGPMERAQFRAGATVGPMTINGVLSETRISARDRIGAVTVTGHMFDTAIQAGGDLGPNVLPGAGNHATTGHIASVNVGGNLSRSSIVAGLLRGPDGFFGTADDDMAPGRSTIGNVTVAGTAIGSNLNSQQYRIASTGTLGNITFGGQPGASQGNFQITTLRTESAPIRVLDLDSRWQNQVWTTWIYFNQSMNESTVGPALTVSEVRRGENNVQILIPLTEGVHYTLTAFDPVENRIGVVFSQEVTSRNLDDQTGQPGSEPGPGVYRFYLSADVLRASVVNARLAGDLEGFGNSSRDFSGDAIVGDAGDRLESGFVIDGDGTRVDFYGPTDLDLVFDNNYTPDGLPDPNVQFRIRGYIGDHPDSGGTTFRSPADSDIYQITLRAGQILRLGAMEGPAEFASRLLVSSTGEVQGGVTDATIELPGDPFDLINRTSADHFLIKETGTYFIIITNHDFWDDPTVIPVVFPEAGIVGEYRFTVEVADDGSSGFSADTESGNGMPVVNAPAAILFAGPSGIFGTEDDQEQIVIGDYIFRLDPGPDGVRGTDDDIVIGTNGLGVVSQRVGNQLSSTINAAIGPRGHAGVPGQVTPDVDIYHLNNRQPIAPGQLITITVRLAEIGADLGSFSTINFTDYRGDVQFGLFETTGSQAIDDALLVFSPTEFLPIAGEPGELARQGQSVYGFDANGDFFITFVTPGSLIDGMNQPASYAVYLQGVFNTDYSIHISQTDAPQNIAMPRAHQNVFIETNGGLIDWLEVGGLATELAPFSGGVLGFVGNIDNLPVEKYIMDNVLAGLQAMFTATGANITVSTNPIHFEFQDFSTVFVTSTNDPITIFNTNNFGYSQRSDPFNLDRNDEAVVFMPSFTTLGYTGSRADIDQFTIALTAAIARRIGELVGLRITAFDFGFPSDVMSSSSVFLPFAAGFIDSPRALSGSFDIISDTNFFLGQQNGLALLTRNIRPI